MEDRRYNATCIDVHVHAMTRTQMVKIFGEEVVGEIDNGTRISAPILNPDECSDCLHERERQDRLCREADLDLFDRTLG